MLKVWGRKSSSNVQALMWCIAELGLSYERVDAGLMYGVNNTPEYLAKNPNGTVPTFQDGDNETLVGERRHSAISVRAVWPRSFLAKRPGIKSKRGQVGGMVQAEYCAEIHRTCVLAGCPHSAIQTRPGRHSSGTASAQPLPGYC